MWVSTLYTAGMAKKMTTETFIKKARETHGDTYDYSQSEYVRANDNVLIGCPQHGLFGQRASRHIAGSGCPQCKGKKISSSKSMSTEQFIEKARKTHGDKYDYSKAVYTKGKEKVTIICPEHGEFDQYANNHLKGVDCPDCAHIARYANSRIGVGRLSQEEFLKRCHAAHGDTYDYSKSVYTGKENKVTIICPVHGEFEQTAVNHWNGKGCYQCSGRMNLTQEQFVAKAREAHGDTYDYSMSHFTKTNEKVAIRCKTHGVFMQEANSHLRGTGCPMCALEARSENMNYAAAHVTRMQTVREKYGVDNVLHLDEIQDKVKATVRDRYGVDNVLQSEEVQRRRVETNMHKYGASSYIGSEEGKKRVAATNVERYGVVNIMQDPEVRQRQLDARRDNGTFNTSQGEEELYALLVAEFGEADVHRQYRSEVYPFMCDFYVASRDLYIELNAFWKHGFCWYDPNNSLMMAELEKKQSQGHDMSVHTDRDVMKRETARKNNLNYIVFWDDKIRDAQLWFADGCPDGHDWEREYSWLPHRPTLSRGEKPTRGTGPGKVSQNTVWHQFDVFYGREIALWEESHLARKSGLRLDVLIYYNRLQHASPKPLSPSECRDKDILNGIRQLRLEPWFSQYRVTPMEEAIRNFNIRSVYDPCAGWGERLTCCANNNVHYVGVDINHALRDGHQGIIADMKDDGTSAHLSVMYEDAACVDLQGLQVDAVITCPPYGDTEIYTPQGAENYSRARFLQWWTDVVGASMVANPRYFCFQISQKWKREMVEIVQAFGFTVISDQPTLHRSSNFTRKKGGVDLKQSSEFFVVLERT